MTPVSPLRGATDPCGCFHESLHRWRVLRFWRCRLHYDRYVRAEVVFPVRRCESCGRRRARYRVTFGDGAAWLLCPGCELPRSI